MPVTRWICACRKLTDGNRFRPKAGTEFVVINCLYEHVALGHVNCNLAWLVHPCDSGHKEKNSRGRPSTRHANSTSRAVTVREVRSLSALDDSIDAVQLFFIVVTGYLTTSNPPLNFTHVTPPLRSARVIPRSRRLTSQGGRADAKCCRSRMLGELRKRFVLARPRQRPRNRVSHGPPRRGVKLLRDEPGSEVPTSDCPADPSATASKLSRRPDVPHGDPAPRIGRGLACPSAELPESARRRRRQSLW